jgi:hypothetical protein
MPEWLVQPEWDEGDGDTVAVGTGEVIEADTADAARDFYLTAGDGKSSRPTWVSCRPVEECRSSAVEAGRRTAQANHGPGSGTTERRRRQAAADVDQQPRIEARESLAKMETRLVWIGDQILRFGRRARHPFGSRLNAQ